MGSGKEVMHLIESLGLQHVTLASSSSARTRYIFYKGQLEKVPTSLPEAFVSPLTRSFPFWIYKDLFSGKVPSLTTETSDVSISEFINHRFGNHVSEVLLDSVMSGVYAGDVQQLSARSTLNTLYEYSTKNTRSGSIIEAILKEQIQNRIRNRSNGGTSTTTNEIFSSPFIDQCSKASSISFVDGTETLAKELVYRLQNNKDKQHTIELCNNSKIIGINKIVKNDSTSSSTKTNDNNFEKLSITYETINSSVSSLISVSPVVKSQNHTITADMVISALPANTLANILRYSSSTVAVNNLSTAITNLQSIPYASVGIACMGWKNNKDNKNQNPSLLKYQGFGYLVPSKERGPLPPTLSSLNTPLSPLPVLGMVWDSHVFPGQITDYAQKKRNLRRYNNQCVDTKRDNPNTSTPLPNDTSSQPPSGYVLPTTADHIPSFLKEKETRLTVMMGGATWPDIANTDKQVIEELGLRTVREHVRMTNRDPDVVQVSVAKQAIPQYTVGHSQRVSEIENNLHREFNKKLLIVGNSFKGVGVADTVSQGLSVGRSVAKELYPELC